MARPTATQNRALIIEVNYCYYAIPLTPEVEAARALLAKLGINI